MKTIKLAQGQTAFVDDEDFEKVIRFRWSLGGGGYACTRTGSKKTSYMHRVVLPGSHQDIDHINGNKLDNQKHNLRPASRAQNNANSCMSSRNTSGFKGVIFEKAKASYPRPWRAQTKVNGRMKSIGYFRTPEEASKAYCSFMEERFGDFFNKEGAFA